MATDKILVERQTDGERCGECYRTYDGESYPYCDIFGERVPGGKFRCPACLATPSARELTPEMVEAVKGLLNCMSLAGWSNDPTAIRARAAFGIEEATK